MCRSWTTAEIDTFINDVSTARTNIAIANTTARRVLPGVAVRADRVSSDWSLSKQPIEAVLLSPAYRQARTLE